MTEINEEHFLQHIQKNPDLELARGIYADWLEEQGDDRAELVRNFNKAINGDDSSFRLLNTHFGNMRYLINHDVPVSLAPRIAVDIVWTIIDRTNEYIRSILKEVWSGNSLIPDLSYSLISQHCENFHDVDLTYSLGSSHPSLVLYDVIYWHTLGQDGSLEDNLLDRDYRLFYLIILSYILFGTNVLPNSYEREGLK